MRVTRPSFGFFNANQISLNHRKLVSVVVEKMDRRGVQRRTKGDAQKDEEINACKRKMTKTKEEGISIRFLPSGARRVL
jgi:hypothetical protein